MVDGIDMRKEFSEFFDRYSDNALLIRIKSDKVCNCVDSLSKAPKKECRRCLGTGKIHLAEKIRIRSKQTTSSDSLPKNVSMHTIGSIGVGVREFYMNKAIRIKQDDFLLFCEWTGDVPLLNEYSSLYRILNVDMLKADSGRDEYIKATSTTDPLNFRLRFDGLIKNINGNAYYLAIREE